MKHRQSGLRRLLFLVGIVAAGLVAFYTVRFTKEQNVQTVMVARHTVTQNVIASGHIRAQGIAPLYPSTTGIITAIYVSDGQSVSEGQDLFAIKSTASDQEKQSAYAAYLAAQTNLNSTVSTADTLRSDMYDAWKKYYDLATNDTYEEEDGTPKDLERGAVEFQTSKYDWTAAEAKYRDQQEAIGASQANVSALWELYQATQDSVTKAPSGGIVANVIPAVGDRVTALPATSATPVLSLTNFESFYLEVDIKETDIPHLALGQTAVIVLDALPNQEFKGIVEQIDLLGKNSGGVITYTVRIRLTDTNPSIRHMMTATGKIVVSTIPDALTIPPAALQELSGERGVETWANGKREWHPVLIGTAGSEWIEVLDGVHEGDKVVLPTVE